MTKHSGTSTLALGALAIALVCMNPHTAVSASDQVQAKLVPDVTSAAAGTSFWVATVLTMAPDWHTYWKNPGDAGLATTLAWTLPEGVTAGEIQWPTPERHEDEVGVFYGYSTEVWLLTHITVADSVAPGTTLHISGKVKWLACGDVCIPGSAPVELDIPVSASAITNESEVENFKTALARIPRSSPDIPVTVNKKDTVLILNIPRLPSTVQPIMNPYFFPYEGATLDHTAPQSVEVSDAGHHLRLKPSPYATTVPDRLEGVLQINADYAIEVSVPVN